MMAARKYKIATLIFDFPPSKITWIEYIINYQIYFWLQHSKSKIFPTSYLCYWSNKKLNCTSWHNQRTNLPTMSNTNNQQSGNTGNQLQTMDQMPGHWKKRKRITETNRRNRIPLVEITTTGMNLMAT